jgi:hypothetical protein
VWAVYPYHADEAPTAILPAPTRVLNRMPHMWLRGQLEGRRAVPVVALVGAIAVLAAVSTAAVWSLEAGDHDSTADQTIQSPADDPSIEQSAPTGQGAPAAATPPAQSERAARQAWVRQYGQDRKDMPNLPDVATASVQQQAAAADLLAQTEVSTAAYSDIAKAQAAGFDLQAALANADKAQPKLRQRLARIDSGHAADRPPVLRVVNRTNTHDARVLDPAAPEFLLYEYHAHSAWQLIGAAYLANESFPQAPPDPGGAITRWSFSANHPVALTMTLYFTAGGDLAHAYAVTP